MRRSGAPSPSGKVPLNGHFRNGIWYCNCIPRLPAIQYLAKRETPNKGRSFYACKKDRNKENKCNFFLWTEEAHTREVNNVLTNSRSEVEGTPSQRPKKRQRTLHESITPAKEKRQGKTPVTSLADLDCMLNPDSPSATAQSSTMKTRSSSKEAAKSVQKSASSDENDDLAHTSDDAQAQSDSAPDTPSAAPKRKRSDVEEYSDLTSGEEQELVALANNSAQPQTKQRNAFATPSGPRTLIEDGMATPLTEKPTRRVLFADPSSPITPKRDLAASSTSPPSSQQQQDPATPGKERELTQEIMALLYDQNIDGTVRRKIRSTLDRHAARAKGLERGRDASREAAKKAEARVAELQQRVADLENQRRLDGEARQKMRTDLMKLYRES
ncbi:putative px domain-containing protein [Daldinia childiae]|uniref:putative px domain-containing protein n=1 Tax=Daldinia childiae TaxID=326645 RepID=UPI001448A1E9|nr:putative px domain-containing protein [Daldinia childiae]KAF3056624.1 putative px domain-containing protein [Daldinia childiae]